MTIACTLPPGDRTVGRPAERSRENGRPLAARLRARFARLARYFESHDDYFREMEDALSPATRDRRRDRRAQDRLALIATLGR